MFSAKKRTDHAEGDDGEDEGLNFAWVVMVGMQMGYRERELGRMYFGKWCDLFEEYKKLHNFQMKKGLYKVHEKPVSMLDL